MKKFLLLTACFVTALSFGACTKSEEPLDILETLKFSQERVQLHMGDSMQLEIEASLEIDEIDLEYTSSNEEIATVSADGVVTGIKEGRVDIQAHSRIYGNTALCKVIVSDITIRVEPAECKLNIFETQKLKVLITQGIETDIKWESEDPDIASVDDEGNITGTGEGSTVITATETVHGVWDECVVTVHDNRPFPEGTGVGDDPYIISTPQHLVKFVQFLNGDLTSEIETTYPMDQAYYEIGADLDMNGTGFVPAVSFSGHLNGNNHKISNLTIIPTGNDPVAMFSTTDGAAISNLSLENIKVTVTSEPQLMTAAIVGKSTDTKIDNCHVKGNITSGAKDRFYFTDGNNGSSSVVGGLIAYDMNGTVTNCSFEGYVSGKNQFVGGIIAVAEGSRIDRCSVKNGSEIVCMMNHVGGIVSYMRLEAEVTNCTVEGAIKGSYAYNGGIAGKIESGRIDNCVVAGNAEVQGHVSNTDTSYVGTGGIAGLVHTTDNRRNVYINNCACYCPISANVSTGGIVGYVRTANIADNIYITNCLYKGTLTVVSKNSYDFGIASGIAAYCHDTNYGNVTIANCASLLDGISFHSSTSAAGFGGLAGFVRYNTSFSTCYSNLEVADIVSYDQNLPIMDYSNITQYGGMYGVSYSATNNVSFSYCYYSDSGKIGREIGAPTKTECEALSNQAMTDGTLLAELNTGVNEFNSTSAPELQASQWVANADGYPVPSSVPADPGFGSTTSKTRVSLIGDSISTFSGYLPTGYNTFYPTGSVISASQTYWYKLIYNYMSNAKLDMNIAWTGTLVTRCTNTKYASEHWYGHDFCARFIDKGMGNPDVILIHGGTNDVSGRGEVSLYPGFAINGTAIPDDNTFAKCFATAEAATSRSAIEALDDTCFVNAYIKLISLIHQQYPDAKVVMLIGDWLPAGARQTIHKIADHYGALYGYKCVDFQDIELFEGTSVIPKETGCHPNEAGFEVMASYIYEQVGSYID